MKILLLLVNLFCLMVLMSCQTNELTIVNDGKSEYQIMIPEDASQDVLDAANTLRHYIKIATMADLPVEMTDRSDQQKVISIRQQSTMPVEYVGYYMDGKNLIIEGGSERSVKYAVYEFLEQELDCQFFAPDMEIVPKRESLFLEKELKYNFNPPVLVRTVHSKLFYENPVFADKQRVTYEAFPNYAPEARVHSFHRFVPVDMYYALHPEYYALIDGKRRTTQLCLSHPDVLEIVKKAVSEAFKDNPKATVVSVSPNDNTQYCKCKECSDVDKAEESPSGSLIRFVNKVAEAFPDKQISTLAYQYTRKACKTKPADNVLVTLCSIECDRSSPIEEKCADFANDLREWKKLTDHIRIWDYTTQFTNFLAPFPNMHTLAPNIRFFTDNNAQWIFEQHSHNPSELFELRSYLMARLLWDPNRDTELIVDEFVNGYYAAAGPYVAKYIRHIHKALADDPDFFLFLYGGPSQAFDSFLNPSALNVYNQCFDEAERAVVDNKQVLIRVKRARLGVRYATLEACRANLNNHYSLSNTDFVQEELAAFTQSCTEGDITMMNETRFMVSDYLALYNRNLERVAKENLALAKPVKLLTTPKKYADEDPQTLTDNAFGGGSFYANWLGFEGNHMVAVIDLENEKQVSSVATGFLQVVNHVVFFPVKVEYASSLDGKNYDVLGEVGNGRPLTKESKINDIQMFSVRFPTVKARYIKIKAFNMKTPPEWHHAVGLPSWIFADEVQVN